MVSWEQKQREARAALAVASCLLVCPDPGVASADSRAGHCRECGEPTDHVAVWNGKAATLCTVCTERIRAEV